MTESFLTLLQYMVFMYVCVCVYVAAWRGAGICQAANICIMETFVSLKSNNGPAVKLRFQLFAQSLGNNCLLDRSRCFERGLLTATLMT